LQALITGEIPLAIMSDASVTAALKSGKVKALVVAAPKRLKEWPEIPSIVEFLPNFQKPSSWIGLFAPPNLPTPILARLHAETVKASNAPDTRAKLEGLGMELWGSSPEEFVALIRSDIELCRKLADAIGLKPE
jgi:tripartite-type tricarboxylate transporter receptor subunit TctC